MFKKFKAFTLAEVLITLAIIGVIAAVVIPSVIVNSQQSEFKTGLKKAVSTLNSAITLANSVDGESPYDAENIVDYLQKHLNVMKESARLDFYSSYKSPSSQLIGRNYAFYTLDGMRFEYGDNKLSAGGPILHETGSRACGVDKNGACMGCGSRGLSDNPYNTDKPPCSIMVDVNGDRKPYPANIRCDKYACAQDNLVKMPTAESKLLSDTFIILITESKAIPYGVAAQKAMYNEK